MESIDELSKLMDDVSSVIDQENVFCYGICDLLKEYRTFYIPDFQRFYIWVEKNILEFYKDINSSKDKRTELFLGNSIFSFKGKDVEVIDGQQRLITFLILLRCIMRNKKANHSDVDYFKGILENITLGGGFKIKLLNPTLKFFDEYILHDRMEESEFDPSLTKIDPVKRIIMCRNNFDKNIQKLGSVEINQLSNFVRKFIKIVAIFPKILGNQIYDSINSKGVPLTDADKIKNFLFQIVEESKEEELYKNWYDLLKIFNYSSKEVSHFLKLYWTTTKEDPKNTLYHKVIEFFEQNADGKREDPLEFSRELLGYAKIYFELTKSELDLNFWGGKKYGLKIIEVLKNLKYLDMQNSYFIILEIRSSFKDYFENDAPGKFFESIVDFFKDVESYSFLHVKLFDKYPQEIKDLYSNFSIQLKKSVKRKKEVFSKIRSELKERILKNLEKNNFEDRIVSKCRPPIFFTRQEKIYLLYRIFLDLTKTGLHHLDINSISENSIEHIMPRSIRNWKKDIENYVNDWEEYPSKEKDERVKKYHETFLEDLGNQSILTQATNSELNDLSFSDKLKILSEKEADNRLFEGIIRSPEWSNKEIALRRNSFIERLRLIFSPSPMKNLKVDES